MRWVKGQSGNPNGRSKISRELREQSDLDRANYKMLISRCLNSTVEQLQQIINDPNSTGVARLAAEAFIVGDKDGKPPHALVEVATGPLVDDYTHDERRVVEIYREQKEAVIYAETPPPAITDTKQLSGAGDGGAGSTET